MPEKTKWDKIVAVKLKVAELLETIQGEGTRAGRLCALVRLAGCNLRCSYCDTAYARVAEDAQERTIAEVVDEVEASGLELVLVTGGEPLLQAGCAELLERLADAGLEVLVETNGSIDIADLDERVVRIMDIKCPASGESDKVRWENIRLLGPADEVKFVICDRGDYDWAAQVIQRERLSERCCVLLGPAFGALEPRILAEWMLADRLEARLQLQLHKLIWPDEGRGR